MAISVAGGDGQDQAALQLLIDAIDFGLSPREAVRAMRFGTDHFVGSFGQTPPKLGSLTIYSDADRNTIAELKSRGHHVTEQKPPLWNPSMLAIDPITGQIEVAGDPKAGRHSAAY
jgi:gamma-glutamyltranspeptidase/glutathione hydrolase